MIKRGVKKYFLDFEKTFPYFRSHIQCGRTFSERMIERIDFHQGVFFTFLPTNTVSDRLYEFSCGGIIPAIPYGEQIYSIKGYLGGFHPQQVMTMDHEFSAFIAAYLQANPRNGALIDSAILESDDTHAYIQNVDMIPYEKEVQYFLNSKNSVDEIYVTIRKSGQVWHFLAILTIMENKISAPLRKDDLDRICDNARFVIAGAYDGEGYIFWEKK